MPESLQVLDAAAPRFGFEFRFKELGFAACDGYLRRGEMMPQRLEAL